MRWLAAEGLSRSSGDDAAVVIAELLANGIRVAKSAVVLDLMVRSGQCYIAVTDDGPGFRQPPPEALPPLDAEGSRGLYLVRTLSQGFAVQSSPTGTTVRCRLPFAVAADT